MCLRVDWKHCNQHSSLLTCITHLFVQVMIFGKSVVIFRNCLSNLINDAYCNFFFPRKAFSQIHPTFPWGLRLAKDQCTYCISEVTDDFCPLSRSVPSDLQLLGVAPCPIQSPTCFLTQSFLCQRTNCFIQKMEIDGGSSLWQHFQ